MLPRICVFATILVIVACETSPDTEPEPDPTVPVNDRDLPITVVATDLQAPWEVVFTDDDRIFVSERDVGHILELTNDDSDVFREFDVDTTGEGGLMGMAVSPDYDNDRLLYVYMTTATDNRVLRLDVTTPEETEIVISDIPSGAIHNGGRIAFGPDDHLWIATGDAGNPSVSQDQESLAGKILRLEPDGSIPDDNPFDDSPVYAMGLRNVQGLAWNSAGQLYATEFGPDVDDEINRIEAGQNYGWPEVTGEADDPNFTDPIFVRQPPVASWSGATFLVDGDIPEWEDHLFVATLRGNRLWRLELSDDGHTVVDDEELLVEQWGRLRKVTQAPDGSLWILTNNRDGRGSPADDDDRILRIGP